MNFLCRKISCYSCKYSTLKGSEAYFPHLMNFFFPKSAMWKREGKSNFKAETSYKHYLPREQGQRVARSDKS